MWNEGVECGFFPHPGRLLDTVEVQFVVEGLAVDAEQFRSLRLVAARRSKGPADLLLLAGGNAQREGGGGSAPRNPGRKFAAGKLPVPRQERRRHGPTF